MFIDEINIAPLLKAFKKFESFRLNDTTEQERAGIIQAFEYNFELVWKIMKRLIWFFSLFIVKEKCKEM